MITKQLVKNELIKRKQTCSLRFVSVFKFQEIIQNRSKEFLGNKNMNKKNPGKATGHNDHYMIIMSGQRPKNGSNCQLTGPYLQR